MQQIEKKILDLSSKNGQKRITEPCREQKNAVARAKKCSNGPLKQPVLGVRNTGTLERLKRYKKRRKEIIEGATGTDCDNENYQNNETRNQP